MGFKTFIKRIGSIFNPSEAEKEFDSRVYSLYAFFHSNNNTVWEESFKETIEENIKYGYTTLLYVKEFGVMAVGKNKDQNQMFYYPVGYLDQAELFKPYRFDLVKANFQTITDVYPDIKEFKNEK